jgi:hypothetical protein
MTNEDLKGQLRKRYAEVALAVWGQVRVTRPPVVGLLVAEQGCGCQKVPRPPVATHLAAALTRRRRR